jgi:hypothetical protein
MHQAPSVRLRRAAQVLDSRLSILQFWAQPNETSKPGRITSISGHHWSGGVLRVDCSRSIQRDTCSTACPPLQHPHHRHTHAPTFPHRHANLLLLLLSQSLYPLDQLVQRTEDGHMIALDLCDVDFGLAARCSLALFNRIDRRLLHGRCDAVVLRAEEPRHGHVCVAGVRQRRDERRARVLAEARGLLCALFGREAVEDPFDDDIGTRLREPAVLVACVSWCRRNELV